MDFYRIQTVWDQRSIKFPVYKIQPIFQFKDSKDLVCKGGDMYAFWDGNHWNTSINDLVARVDNDIYRELQKVKDQEANPLAQYSVKLMSEHTSNVMKEFAQYCKLRDHSEIAFNTKIIFSEDTPKREDYSTTQLKYTPKPGDTPAFDKLFTKLYDPEELDKIMWFIGALLTNNMKHIQKFMYLYGSKGSGKGTVINLFEMLFEGYNAVIDLARLTGSSEFATSQVREVPLLIDSDSKINRIKDDTNLLKLTSHETLSVNMKHKQIYDVTFEGLLITASNQRYQVNNIDSGITRRAVVVHPSNRRHSSTDYHELVSKLPFELAHIAYKSIQRFEEMGPYYYEDYVDLEMAEATDHIFAFVREHANVLGDPVTLKKASELYRLYLEDIGFDTSGYKKKIKEELKRYYTTFEKQRRIEGEVVSNVYSGFKYNLVFPNKDNLPEPLTKVDETEQLLDKLGLKMQHSIFDELAETYPAQYTNDRGNPLYKRDNVKTTLKDIDTKKLHYVRLPLNHIVVDFDIKDETGSKSLYLNLKEASKFPKTYTELSKSGAGVHLHYIYDGDVSVLEKLYDEDIEVKVFTGKSALRRRVTKCNNLEPVHISTGLPEKERKTKLYDDVSIMIWNEKKMRKVIINNLKKKYHPNTKPSVDFIVNVFDEAQKQDVKYDLRDLKQDILVFAATSTNQSEYCVKAVNNINYCTIEDEEQDILQKSSKIVPDDHITFFDIEVFPNLLVVCYKRLGEKQVHKLINPTPIQIETVCKRPLMGFNNRRYDNHIMYAAMLGQSNINLFRQSQRIINKESGAFYGGAYELSYADIYEYNSKKQSLKKWEIELGIHHDELELPWDQPVDPSMWERVAEYCCNDVLATEAVFKATYEDYEARLIISELSGLSVNSKTQDHARAFIFDGLGEKQAMEELVYTDLSKEFPGYKYEFGKSTYKGKDVNEGGRVVSNPGIYHNVGLFDIASMHPNSAIQLNAFGKYTDRFKDLVNARLAIKHKDFDKAKKMFGGALAPYLDKDKSKNLSYALKIIINIVYGMTSAKYANAFRHPDNNDNIVAKRGSLFMVDLQEAVEKEGYKVVHIKTDSIKVANVDQHIADFIMAFGKKYGYTFEWEATYETICLINKADYVFHNEKRELEDEVVQEWGVTGAILAKPYVFKTLFTKEPLTESDFAIVKEVKNASIYLSDKFIGRIAELYASISGQEAKRVKDDGAEGALNGTKGYMWRLMSDYQGFEDLEMRYYHDVVEAAYKKIAKVGDPTEITDYRPRT